MKSVLKICLLVIGVLVICMWANNYVSYKKLQCLDHNFKGFALRFVPADVTMRRQEMINAKRDAIIKSDYSILFGCRIYENGKLTKFTYDYPMTDDAFYADYDNTLKRIQEVQKKGGGMIVAH